MVTRKLCVEVLDLVLTSFQTSFFSAPTVSKVQITDMLLLSTSFFSYPLPRSHRQGGFEKNMFPSTSYSFLFQIKAAAHIYTYIYILVWLDTPSNNIWVYSKFRETIPSSKSTHVFLQKSCMFLVIESSLSPKFWRILRGKHATPEQSTLNPQDCRKKLMDSTVLDRYENLFTFNQTYYVYVFSKHTFFSYDLGKLFWDTHPKSHIFLEWSKDQGISGHISIFGALVLAHFLLDPSHPTNGAAKLLKTEPWKCNR